jgi:hypothetical protein
MAIEAEGEGWWSWMAMQGEALRGDPDYGNLFMGFQHLSSRVTTLWKKGV